MNETTTRFGYGIVPLVSVPMNFSNKYGKEMGSNFNRNIMVILFISFVFHQCKISLECMSDLMTHIGYEPILWPDMLPPGSVVPPGRTSGVTIVWP